MDPDSQPTKINLPGIAETWGTEGFNEAFLEAVSENSSELPFWAVCMSGSPSCEEDAECWDLTYDITGPSEISGSFSYSFLEDTNQGCRDITHSERLNGSLDFHFDWKTETLTIPIPRTRAEYDSEEF